MQAAPDTRNKMSKIVFASGNPGKIREVSELLADLDVALVAQGELGITSPPETGNTFVANALLKARHAAAESNLPAIADDSGIAVDALDGRPGVRSARYAGENASDAANVDKLLEALADIPDPERGAAFHCAAVLAWSQETREPLIAEAAWRGMILRERLGEGGFGYDPVFFDVDAGLSGAQMSREQKNRVSHRGRAFRELRAMLATAR